METFGASVQYNDWKGTAAADDADGSSISRFLEQRGELSDGEFVVGITVWLGEMHGKIVRPHLSALIIDAYNFEAAQQAVNAAGETLTVKRDVELDLSMEDFLTFFKRFAVCLSMRELDLTGLQYESEEG